MREAEIQIKCRSLHRSLESYALDLELFAEALADALHHVMNEAAGKSVQCFHITRLRLAH